MYRGIWRYLKSWCEEFCQPSFWYAYTVEQDNFNHNFITPDQVYIISQYGLFYHQIFKASAIILILFPNYLDKAYTYKKSNFGAAYFAYGSLWYVCEGSYAELRYIRRNIPYFKNVNSHISGIRILFLQLSDSHLSYTQFNFRTYSEKSRWINDMILLQILTCIQFPWVR